MQSRCVLESVHSQYLAWFDAQLVTLSELVAGDVSPFCRVPCRTYILSEVLGKLNGNELSGALPAGGDVIGV